MNDTKPSKPVEIVCIDTSHLPAMDPLVKGGVYTVDSENNTAYWLRLPGHDDPLPYYKWRFRLV